ncbi:MAG: flippase [Planctomycetota bacterium]
MLDLRKIIKNFGSATGMRLFSAGISFALVVYLARTWSPELFGQFGVLFAFFSLLQQMPLLGLHVVLTRDIANNPETRFQHAVNATSLSLVVAGLLAVALGCAGRGLYPDSMYAGFWLIGLCMFPTAIIVVCESILVGEEKMGTIALVNSGESILRAIVSLLVVIGGGSLTAVMICFLAARVAAAAGYLGLAGMRSLFRWRDLQWEVLRGYLAVCPAFLGIMVLSAGMNRVDFILISKLGSERQVAYYSSAYRLFEVALMVPSLLAFVLFPAFARFFEHSRERFDELGRNMIRLLFLAGIPCSILIAVSAEPILSMIYGERYIAATPVLAILIFVPVVTALDQVMTMLLLAGHQQRFDLAVLVLSFTTYVGLLFLLIPPYGIVGAAVATAATASVQLAFRHAMVRWRLGVGGLPTVLIRPMVAAAAMGATTLLLRDYSLPMAWVGGGVMYFCLVFWGRRHQP